MTAECNNGDIQVTGIQEMVEICLNDSWTKICADNLDKSDTVAALACQQLGFSASSKLTEIFFGVTRSYECVTMPYIQS